MFKRLVDTLEQFNADQIPVYVVIPASDTSKFNSVCGEKNTFRFLAEEDFDVDIFTQEDSLGRPGYLNQQIYKLGFSNLGIASHYLVVDSDVQFIKNFHRSDFFDSRTGEPLIFATSDRDLLADKEYLSEIGIARSRQIAMIREHFDLPEEANPPTVHGMQVLSSAKVAMMLRHLENNCGITSYKDMIRTANYEFNWYAAFRFSVEGMDQVRESPFKTYHGATPLLKDTLIRPANLELSNSYLAVCVNSNYQKTRSFVGPESINSSSILLASIYLPLRDLTRLLVVLILSFPLASTLSILRAVRGLKAKLRK